MASQLEMDFDFDDVDIQGMLDLLGVTLAQLTPLEKTKKYLRSRRNKKDLEMHAKKEKELRRLVLQAAESGYVDIMRRALPVLKIVQQRMPTSRPQSLQPELNFQDDREKARLWNMQFYTPLMYACEGGHSEMVQFLLKEGAQVDYTGGHYVTKGRYKKRIGSGLSAMHVACIQGRADVVQLLITRAEDKLLKQSLSDIINVKSKERWTPLMYAVKEGHIEVVDVLLQQPSLDVLAINRKGQTALHIAGLHSRLRCLQAMHTTLAVREASRDKLAQEDENPYLKTDKAGHNVLHRICKGSKGPEEGNVSVEILRWLFETMPHLNSRKFHDLGTEEKGYTMLLLACDNGNKGLVEYLLTEKAVDVSCTAEDGKTGLHLAAIHDYPNIAELMISHGISLTAQDKESKRKDSDELVGEDTALHIAVRKSSTDVEKMIRSSGTEKGVALDIKNKLGETPDEVKREEIIPLEIRRLGDEAVQRYRQLLRKGKKKKMPRCNLIALGEQRVGKTSLLCLLMGKEFVENRDPTRGIDNKHVDVLTTSVNVSSETWKAVELGDIIRKNDDHFAHSVAEGMQHEFKTKSKKQPPPKEGELARAITDIEKYLQKVEEEALKQPQGPSAPGTNVPHNPSPQPTSSSTSDRTVPKSDTKHPAHPEPSTRQPPLERPMPEPMETHTPQPKPKEPIIEKEPQLQPPTSQPSKATLKRVGRGKYSRVSRQTSKKIVSSVKQGPSDKEPELQFNTLDFAGQKEYRAMHHCFIVRRAIFLVVFNLQIVREALKATEKKQQALEEIQYWLNSIHAHIHKSAESAKAESLLKRIMLVGTHKNPDDKDPITDEDMQEINEELERRYITGTSVLDDMYRAVRGGVWFAAVENSIDGPKNEDRKKSGACSLQKSIHEAWNELPFKDEQYPTTWLRFEAFLIQSKAKPIVDAATIREAARETYGIGEEMEEDIELALGFFHDTGTIVYPRKLPTLYLNEEQKKKLDGLILLDPAWLTKMMRIVLELESGKGSELTNHEKEELKKTGCAKLSLLRKCWSDDNFDNLILMLQSFCLIFPLRTSESPAAPITTTPPSAESSPHHSQSEGQASPTHDMVYLIPSKLCHEPLPAEEKIKRFNFTFVFDFHGFLPTEVYHRLLCLMLKNQNNCSDSKGKFTANYFKIYNVEKCNWLVQRKDSKLLVSVKYPPQSHTFPRSSYVLLIHTEYLRAICNENGSSLQGLKYDGGPEHVCEDGSVVVPFVSFPDKERGVNWECKDCFETVNVDRLLDPKFQFKTQSGSSENGPSSGKGPSTVETDGKPTKDTGHTINVHAAQVVVAQPKSVVTVQLSEPPPTAADPVASVAQFQIPENSPVAIEPLAQKRSVTPAIAAASEAGTQPCKDRILEIRDLLKVLSVLKDVTEWKMLGLALGLQSPTLDRIEQENKDNLSKCKYEMVKSWLNQTDGCSPSRVNLVKALKHELVQHSPIAEQIEKEMLLV